MEPRHENAYVLNVMAEDRPGIVAAVSKAVHSAGGNIDAASQTVLAGYFTLIMVISFERPLEEERFVEGLLRPGGRDSGFQVQLRPYRPAEPAPACPSDDFVVTCFGPDAPGVIYRFSSLLADKGVNIVDLYARLDGQQFVLISQVHVPCQWDLPMLQADLEALGAEQGFTVRLQHENLFVATNQLRMSRQPAARPRDPGAPSEAPKAPHAPNR